MRHISDVLIELPAADGYTHIRSLRGHVSRPMHIEQMKEALAIISASGKLDPTKIPTSSFVIRSFSNLVVLDELTSCILLAHHSLH